MKILALHLKRFIDYGTLRGIPSEELLGSIKAPPAYLHDPAAMLEADDFYTVVNLVAASLKDELLGLRAAEHFSLNTLGAIYKISLNATTVQEAIFYCQEYLRATFPILNISNSLSGDPASIELNIENDLAAANRIILETSLTSIAREMRIISGEHVNIVVSSPYCGAGYPAGWEKGSSFAVTFDHSVLKGALSDRSRHGLDILIPEYLLLIERMKQDGSFRSKVKVAALNMSKPGLPDLETIADVFNITSRTLQRRLVDESVTFRQLIEELKQQICDRLIRHDRFSIADIAQVLGYSEPAAFIRSFKKWHGSSPGKVREKISQVPEKYS